MMRLPQFRFVDARTLNDAVSALSDDPHGTRLLAGGTDLLPNLKRRHQSANTLVGLRRIPELRGVRLDRGGRISIGAMTSLAFLCGEPTLRISHPGFVRAVASISSSTLRNMGTLGGNLCLDTRCTYYNQTEEWRRSIGYCLKECGDTCWVAPSSSRCYAVASSDAVPLLCAIDATVKLVSRQGERTIPVRELHRDDGIDYLAKRRDEILTEVQLPFVEGQRSTYWKLRRRGSIDFPVLGVAASVKMAADGSVERASLFLSALTSAPLDMGAELAPLIGHPWDESAVVQVAASIQRQAAAFDNTDYDLKWRRTMVAPYVEGALRELAGFAPKGHVPQHGARPLPR